MCCFSFSSGTASALNRTFYFISVGDLLVLILGSSLTNESLSDLKAFNCFVRASSLCWRIDCDWSSFSSLCCRFFSIVFTASVCNLTVKISLFNCYFSASTSLVRSLSFFVTIFSLFLKFVSSWAMVISLWRNFFTSALNAYSSLVNCFSFFSKSASLFFMISRHRLTKSLSTT